MVAVAREPNTGIPQCSNAALTIFTSTCTGDPGTKTGKWGINPDLGNISFHACGPRLMPAVITPQQPERSLTPSCHLGTG